jgi:hypothetical protein
MIREVVAVGLESPRLRAHLEDRDRGRIVDVDGRRVQQPGGLREPGVVVVPEATGAHAGGIDPRLGGEHSLHE